MLSRNSSPGQILMRLILVMAALSPYVRAQVAPERKFNVVIVSVENFDDSSPYYNAALQMNIRKATNQLIDFFHTQFGVDPIVLRQRSQTTWEALQQFFHARFPSLVDGNMTLLFVLSHGEPSNGGAYGTDLQIVASDTVAGNLDGTTISFTNDILERIKRVTPGTLLFGFIDTCHSGSPVNIGVSVVQAIDQNLLHLNMMFMGSSLADQFMYKASFTQALVRLWSQRHSTDSPRCTDPDQSINAIRNAEQTILGPNDQLNVSEGYPTVIIKFNGQMCLETFNEDSSIVEVINTTNYSIQAFFKDDSGTRFPATVIPAGQSVPIRLFRTFYTMELYQNNQQIKTEPLDLQNQTIDWIEVAPTDAENVGRALEQAARGGEAVLAAPQDVDSLRQLAYGAYRLAHDNASSQRLEHLIRSKAGLGLDDAWNVAFQPMNVIEGSLVHGSDPDSLALAANQIGQVGDINAAAELFADAAEKARQTGNPQDFATKAYWALSASGEYEEAKKIRDSYALTARSICPDCAPSNQRLLNGPPRENVTIRNIAADQLLHNFADALTVAGLKGGMSSPGSFRISVQNSRSQAHEEIVNPIPVRTEKPLLVPARELQSPSIAEQPSFRGTPRLSFRQADQSGSAPRTTHTITVMFDYDFRLNRACSSNPSNRKRYCMKQFNVYNMTDHGQRTLLMSIPVLEGEPRTVVEISGSTQPLAFAPGQHLIAVTAQSEEGAESPPHACEQFVNIP